MIEPVSRVQSYNSNGVKVNSAKTGTSGDEKPFSMDQALAEESAREEGVYYERSKNETPKQEKKEAPKPENDEIFEKPGADAPLGAIDTGNLVKGIGKLLSDLWSKALKIFSNIWESKPLNESLEKEKSPEEIIEESHKEESLNFYKSQMSAQNEKTDDDLKDDIPLDEFDKNIEMLEHIKPYEDKAIKDALLSGDEERFERIITRDGERHPAISSTLLTQYNAKGQIIQIDPSDENLILRGTSRTNRS